MKYLSHYTEKAQTALFRELGVFFAFGDDQFNEKAIKCIRYASVGAGMICPVVNVKSLDEGLKNIGISARIKDVEENGIDAIIQRELGNYECQIVGSYEDALPSLLTYGITEKEVKDGYKLFFMHCIENDLF